MSDANTIFLFEGRRIDELGWWDLMRYHAAMARSNCGVSGNLDGEKLLSNGISVEFVQRPTQPPARNGSDSD